MPPSSALVFLLFKLELLATKAVPAAPAPIAPRTFDFDRPRAREIVVVAEDDNDEEDCWSTRFSISSTGDCVARFVTTTLLRESEAAAETDVDVGRRRRRRVLAEKKWNFCLLERYSKKIIILIEKI